MLWAAGDRLEAARGGLKVGLTHPTTNEFFEMSSVGLRNK
jgi:hypothetical protein